jgi:hypothetical protein
MDTENLQDALKLLDNGKTTAEVLAMFPEDLELKESLRLAKELKKQASNIHLSENFKNRLFSNIQSSEKPKFSLKEILQEKLKFILPVLTAVAVLLFIIIPKSPSPDQNQSPVSQTSSIDETAQAIISDFTNDTQYTSDDQDINDVRQSYSNYNVNDIYNESSF